MRLLHRVKMDKVSHTQSMIAVYVTRKEKEQIKKCAKEYDRSMSAYLLDCHLAFHKYNITQTKRKLTTLKNILERDKK